MEVRFWGTRGSIASPGADTVRYGGNTSCVEVRTAAGTRVVIDCGTGVRALGEHLMAEAETSDRPPSGHLLIGHTHWDHIQGLPFFTPLFQPGARWHLYGPRGLGQSIGDTLAGQMSYEYFPVTLDQLAADIEYHDLVEGSFRIDDVVVRTRYLNHPALTLGFRLEADGAAVAYLSDHEPSDPGVAAGRDVLASRDDARHVDFARGVDLVIHDAQYRCAEYGQRKGWGHSTVEYAVAVARLAGAGRLALFHHDPSRRDTDLDQILQELAGDGSGPAVEAAAEGKCLQLGDQGGVDARPHETGTGKWRGGGAAALGAEPEEGGPGPEGEPAAIADPTPPDGGGLVLTALPDGCMAAMVDRVAAESGLEVGKLPPVWFGPMRPSTVVVVDREWPDSWDRLAALRARCEDSYPVVLAVTRRRPPAGGDPLVAGWLVWPASPAHLRAKLQAAALGHPCRWENAPLPEDEDRRLESLNELGVLDTAPEERFDRIVRLAQARLQVPVVRVSLVDERRQWFKASVGDDRVETPRDESLCAHAILDGEVFQVPDLLCDDRFADSPVARGPGAARFYAGAPLVMPDGTRMGTLCVVDSRPRVLDDGQLAELRHLAELVRNELLSQRSTAWRPGRSSR